MANLNAVEDLLDEEAKKELDRIYKIETKAKKYEKRRARQNNKTK